MVDRRRRAAMWCGVRFAAILLTTGCALSYERDLVPADAGSASPDGSTLPDGRDGGSTLARDAGGTRPVRDAGEVPDDVPNDVAPPVDEVLSYAERRCAWAARCTARAIEVAWLRGETSCVNAERRRADELRSRGHVPPVSTWCGAPEVDADCDGVDDVAACTPAPGALLEGEPCVADLECGRAMACAGCRCAAFRNEGDDCGTSAPCGPELVCGASDRRCRRRVTLADGERCSSLTPDAAEVCRDGSTCHRGLCVRSPRYRERCDPTGPRCDGTNRCLADADGVTRCAAAIALVAAGEACTSGQYCAGGAPCPRERVCPTTCADDPRTCGLSACDETFDDCLLPPLTCPGS